MAVTLGIDGDSTATGWTSITPSGVPQNGYNGAAPASGNTMFIYCSNSTGKDPADAGYVAATAGSLSTPYRTLAQAKSVLRNGEPDWLLLLKGDTWTHESLNAFNGQSGKSSSEPKVITSYTVAGASTSVPRGTGTGARPKIIPTASTDNGFSTYNNTASDFIAIIGIEFYNSDGDPASGPVRANSGGTPSGISINFFNASAMNWWLIEDVKCSFFSLNFDIESHPYGGTVYFRRNVSCDAYDTTAHSQGLYVEGIDKFIQSENLLDLNGYGDAARTVTNIFSRNEYVQGYTATTGLAGVTTGPSLYGNISSRSGSGAVQLRTGGTLNNELYTDNQLATSLTIGLADQSDPSTVTFTASSPLAVLWQGAYSDLLHNGCYIYFSGTVPSGLSAATIYRATNVVYTASPQQATFNVCTPVGYPSTLSTTNTTSDASTRGSLLFPDVNTTIQNCVFIDSLGAGLDILPNSNNAVITVQNNIFAHTKNASPSSVYAMQNEALSSNITETGNIVYDMNPTAGSNIVDIPGTNSTTGNTINGTYSDPTRTVATYDSTVIGGPGTLVHFMTLARAQSRDNWDSRLMAKSVNDWIRTGFDIGGGTRRGGKELGKF